MENKLLSKLGISEKVSNCKTFDDVLNRGYFESLSEKQQIATYNYFISKETEETRAIPYSDLENCSNDFSITVEGADTSVNELIDNGYSVRQCKEKGRAPRGIAAWLDEGDWKYLGLIYVAPQFNRRGIMGGLIEDGNDGRPITTKVHSNNEIALNAFEKYGFQIQEKRGEYLHLVR